jgi:hypothetical protein
LVLEKRFPEVVDGTPEVIAQQFELAGQNEKAVKYLRQAADRDLRRFAMKEAIAHYSNALRLVTAMPETPERGGSELDICLGLGLAQQIAIGPTADESVVYYERALALTRALPARQRDQFLATWGIWFHKTMTGRTKEAQELADNLVTIARELDNPDLLLEAYHAKIPGLQRTADFLGMKEASDEVIRRYDRERHREHAYYFGGHDARVCAESFSALSLWGLGFPDQAQQMAWQCIKDARELGHAFSLAHALNQGGLALVLLNDVAACQTVAEELYPIAERNKFPWPLAYARFLQGWVTSQLGDRDAGIEQMLKAADEPSATYRRPILLALIAEQQFRGRHLEAAMATIELATDEFKVRDARFYQPEAIRLRGEVLLAQSRDNLAEVETAFRQAIAAAAEQPCPAIGLRAATSLARLLGNGARRTEARDLLTKAYGAFTEGFDWPDLQAAKTLLAELN